MGVNETNVPNWLTTWHISGSASAWVGDGKAHYRPQCAPSFMEFLTSRSYLVIARRHQHFLNNARLEPC